MKVSRIIWGSYRHIRENSLSCVLYNKFYFTLNHSINGNDIFHTSTSIASPSIKFTPVKKFE